jgi:hypothetical protein
MLPAYDLGRLVLPGPTIVKRAFIGVGGHCTGVTFVPDTGKRIVHSDEFIIIQHVTPSMSTKATPASAVDGESEVMTSIDDDGSQARVIVADTSTDDAWIAMSLADAWTLSDCR